MSTISIDDFESLLVLIDIPPESLEALQSHFHTVHYYPDPSTAPIPTEILHVTHVLLTTAGALPSNLRLAHLPELRHIQLGSAGVDGVLKTQFLREHGEVKLKEGLRVTSASGTHVLSIPNWVVGAVISLYAQIPAQIMHARVSLSVQYTLSSRS
jgi:phosphoglycerate dehydrogenase-like enzyme